MHNEIHEIMWALQFPDELHSFEIMFPLWTTTWQGTDVNMACQKKSTCRNLLVHMDDQVYLVCIEIASGLAWLLQVPCALLAGICMLLSDRTAEFNKSNKSFYPSNCKGCQRLCRRQYMPLESAEDGHASNAMSAGKITAFKPYSPNRGVFDDYGADEA